MLGRESIIITLEDVFVCASQRDDQEVISMFLLIKKALFDNMGKNRSPDVTCNTMFLNNF